MSLFFIKSILSLLIILSACIAMITMFEVFGRAERKYDTERLKKLHRINGIFYVLIFLVIAYFCLSFIIGAKADLSSRATFHALFALTIMLLLGLKVLYVRIYKQYYQKVQMVGLLISLITFGMMATSGGYYLLVTKFGSDRTFNRFMEHRKETVLENTRVVVRTDPESIRKGRELYESKCYFCHDAYSSKQVVGPGHKGILKNPFLPVSKKPATPESVANQLRNPYSNMPSFAYLSDDEVADLIAFLNTL